MVAVDRGGPATDLVDPDKIEQIVGIKRHVGWHYARVVSDEQTVYILHSQECRDSGRDLRECPYSLALDRGIHEKHWSGHEDEAVRVTINRSGRLIPVVAGMRFSE